LDETNVQEPNPKRQALEVQPSHLELSLATLRTFTHALVDTTNNAWKQAIDDALCSSHMVPYKFEHNGQAWRLMMEQLFKSDHDKAWLYFYSQQSFLDSVERFMIKRPDDLVFRYQSLRIYRAMIQSEYMPFQLAHIWNFWKAIPDTAQGVHRLCKCIRACLDHAKHPDESDVTYLIDTVGGMAQVIAECHDGSVPIAFQSSQNIVMANEFPSVIGESTTVCIQLLQTCFSTSPLSRKRLLLRSIRRWLKHQAFESVFRLLQHFPSFLSKYSKTVQTSFVITHFDLLSSSVSNVLFNIFLASKPRTLDGTNQLFSCYPFLLPLTKQLITASIRRQTCVCFSLEPATLDSLRPKLKRQKKKHPQSFLAMVETITGLPADVVQYIVLPYAFPLATWPSL